MSSPNSFCPYVGLQPYTEDDCDYFFGRERDQRIISSNLYAAPLTVLYGASGVGKSSVLLAGVVPRLRSAPRTAVVVFREWQGSSPLGMLKLGCIKAVESVRQKPLAVDKTLSLDDLLLAAARAFGGSILIILDQFEEYFLYHPGSGKDISFDVEFARAVNREEVDANFLVAVREDGLSKLLDRFRERIPNLLENRLRLQHLDTASAEDAIRKPLEVYSTRFTPVTIEDELVHTVLTDKNMRTGQFLLSRSAGVGQAESHQEGDWIEAPLLQLVMTRLWKKETEEGSRVLRLSTLERPERQSGLGGVSRIIKTHLDEAMGSLTAVEQDIAARVFDYLVTPSGTKIAHAVPTLAYYAKLPEIEIAPVLDKLSRTARILRTVAPPPDKPTEIRYEIFHDVLAPAILDWRARYVQAQERAAAEKQLSRERRRVAILGMGMVGLLLLLAVMVGLAIYSFKQRNTAIAERNRAEEQTRIAKNARAEALAAQKREKEQRQIAEEQARIAAIRAKEAEAAQKKAEAEAKRAEEQAGIAAIQAEKAEKAKKEAEAAQERAEAQRKLAEQKALEALQARSRGLAAAAVNNLNVDPQLSILLTLYALDNTLITPEAQDALNQAVLASRMRMTLIGHNSEVNDVAFGSDGKLIATASSDKTAKLWDARSGKGLHTLKGHTDEVLDVEFSPDGKYVATAGRDKTVKVWDTSSGRELRTLSGHTNVVNGVAFSPDGRRIATVSVDRTARIWDTLSGKRLFTLSGRTKGIYGVAFSPDGKRIATASIDKTAIIWDVSPGRELFTLSSNANGRELFTLSGHTDKVYGIAFSPDGKYVATASRDKTVKMWDASSGRELRTLSGHNGTVFKVAFSPNGTRLATASSDGTVKVWDASSGKELFTISGHAAGISGVTFSPDGKRIATASLDKTAKIESLPIYGHTAEVQGITFSPDGKHIASASKDKTAKIWDAASSRVLFTLSGHRKEVTDVAFSPDGKRLVTSGKDDKAKVWDTSSGRELLTLSGHSASLYDVDFSPDGTRIATASSDKTARVWNAVSGKKIFTLSGHTDTVFGISFSPDGKRLATASKDGTARIWEASSGKELFILHGSDAAMKAVVFSPDGKFLAAGSSDGVVKLWDTELGKEVAKLNAHNAAVNGISFSSDGRLLVIASSDGTAKVLSLDSKKALFTLTGHNDEVLDAAFSPDGMHVATASADKTILMHTLDIPTKLEELIELARKSVNRSLTSEECTKYLYVDECPSTPESDVSTVHLQH